MEPPPEHYRLSQKVLSEGFLDSSVKIITLVRDPVARNVSAFFNNISNFLGSETLKSVTTNVLVKKFLTSYPHRIATDWFENEFKKNAGVDILSYNLDKNKGYFRINSLWRDILLIKVEIQDSVKVNALDGFIPWSNISRLSYGNVGDKKEYSHQYQMFREKFQVPNDYVDRMYNAPIIQHLYADEEIQAMKSKWQKFNL